MKPRRTPLKRSTKPIRRVSKKRAKEMQTYAQKRRDFLIKHPVCQVWLAENGFVDTAAAVFLVLLHGAGPKSTEIHHQPSWARACGFLV